MRSAVRSAIVSLVAVGAIGFSGAAYADAGWEEALVPVNHVYAPKGFDTNDDSQVVVEGYLPNLCYKSVRHRVRVKGKKVKIEVYSYRERRSSTVCAQMAVPFLEQVSLGQVPEGTYQVTVNGRSILGGRTVLGVSRATIDRQDDYVYANVDRMDGIDFPASSDRQVVLRGYNPSDCYEFDRLEVISNEADTFSVLPIMKQVRELCPMKMVPFAIPFTVPATITTDRVLLHVRAMNGKSVNGLFFNR